MKGRTRKALMPLLLAVTLLATPATSLAQSVFMLQLGSHGSEEEASESWNSLKAKFPDSLAKLTLRISQVALPPDNFVVFRTQAGPIKSRQEANKMCSAVLAASQECFVVETAMFVTPEKAFAEAPVAPVPPPAVQDTTPAPKITGAEPVKTAAPPPPPPVKLVEEKPAPPPVKIAEAKPPAPPAPPPAPPKVQAAAKKELPWDAKLEPSATTLDSELKAEAPPAMRIAAPPAPPPAPPPPKQEMAAAPPPPPPPPPAPPPQKPVAASAPPPPVPTVSPRKANSLVTPMQLGKPIRKEDAPVPESAPPMMMASAPPPADSLAPLPAPAPRRPENEMPKVEMMPTPAPPVAQPQPAPVPSAAMQMPAPAPAPAPASPPAAPASPPPSINVASVTPSMQPLPTMPPPPQLQESPATPGRVEVSEAVRVPLSETAKPFTNPAAAARSMTVPTANPNEKPFFGYGGFPSQTFSGATLWAQMGFFPNEQVAFAYWDKVRETYPDITSSLRVRVTKPYMLAQRGKEGAARVSLRIGPFASRGDLDNICGVTRQQNLECGALREMGSATADSTRGRGDDRVVGDMYRERRHNSDSPFMNSDLDDNFWAQLGTYDSPQKASTAWNGLRQAYGFVLGSLEPNVISPALSSSPKSLFRLRTGPFPTNLAAANTCNSLQRFGISCLVVAD